MKLYRIYTENKNYDDVMKIVSSCFDGFTVIKTEGFWQGQAEHSLIIEVLTDAREVVNGVAYEIKKHNAQESVLVIEAAMEHKFI